MMGEPYLNCVPIKEAFPKAEHWSVVSPEVVVRFRSYRRYSGSPDGSHCARNRRPASVTPPRSPAVLSASLPRCHGPLPYAGAVLWAVKNDITKGTGATTFSPDADCTRAQIVTFLWRTLA